MKNKKNNISNYSKKKFSNILPLFKDKNFCKKIILKKNSTLSQAIQNLNNSGLKICMILDKNDELVGTLTDGDIRRGLLRKLTLKDNITSIINYKPIILNSKNKKNHINELMKENYIEHLPVLNSDKKLIGVFFLNKFFNFETRKRRTETVVIMAGGLGKRLLPLTRNLPKPLIKINGKPMLEQLIKNINKFGFNNFIISINYLGNLIEKYFERGKKFNVKISYIKENKPLGTVGSLYKLKKLKNKDFIVTNCDILSDVDYSDVLNYHKKNSADATMVIRSYKLKNPFDVIAIDGKKFISFETKPYKYENINAGIYVLNSRVLKYLEVNTKQDMPSFFKKMKEKNLKVIVYPVFEKWNDMGDINNIKNSINEN